MLPQPPLRVRCRTNVGVVFAFWFEGGEAVAGVEGSGEGGGGGGGGEGDARNQGFLPVVGGMIAAPIVSEREVWVRRRVTEVMGEVVGLVMCGGAGGDTGADENEKNEGKDTTSTTKSMMTGGGGVLKDLASRALKLVNGLMRSQTCLEQLSDDGFLVCLIDVRNIPWLVVGGGQDDDNDDTTLITLIFSVLETAAKSSNIRGKMRRDLGLAQFVVTLVVVLAVGCGVYGQKQHEQHVDSSSSDSDRNIGMDVALMREDPISDSIRTRAQIVLNHLLRFISGSFAMERLFLLSLCDCRGLGAPPPPPPPSHIHTTLANLDATSGPLPKNPDFTQPSTTTASESSQIRKETLPTSSPQTPWWDWVQSHLASEPLRKRALKEMWALSSLSSSPSATATTTTTSTTNTTRFSHNSISILPLLIDLISKNRWARIHTSPLEQGDTSTDTNTTIKFDDRNRDGTRCRDVRRCLGTCSKNPVPVGVGLKIGKEGASQVEDLSAMDLG
ncbi:hypothetical protein HK102_010637, partial [Quaeritorhiza haematococci]